MCLSEPSPVLLLLRVFFFLVTHTFEFLFSSVFSEKSLSWCIRSNFWHVHWCDAVFLSGHYWMVSVSKVSKRLVKCFFFSHPCRSSSEMKRTRVDIVLFASVVVLALHDYWRDVAAAVVFIARARRFSFDGYSMLIHIHTRRVKRWRRYKPDREKEISAWFATRW